MKVTKKSYKFGTYAYTEYRVNGEIVKTISEEKRNCGTSWFNDYRVVKEYKSEKAALKFLKTIGYAYDELSNDTWNYFGTKYKLSIQR